MIMMSACQPKCWIQDKCTIAIRTSCSSFQICNTSGSTVTGIKQGLGYVGVINPPQRIRARSWKQLRG